MDSVGIGYGGINFPIDECVVCGYRGVIESDCPACGSADIRRIRRITGYLSTVDHFNDAKKPNLMTESHTCMREEKTSLNARLSGIVNESVSDGPSLRAVLFFQGCKHHCPNCHNPQTWDFHDGCEYTVAELLRQLLDTPLIKGITLSGGDPFFQPLAAIQIAHAFHQRGKDVWAYTGFTWNNLLEKKDTARYELAKSCDVLVDGPFILAQRCLDLPFLGSINQRLIWVKESLKQGRIVEWTLSSR